MLVANFAYSKIQNPLAEGLNGTTGNSEDSDLINNALTQTGSGLAFFDNLLPFLLIGVFGFVMLSGGAIMRSPVMIFIGVIILAVLITVAVIYSNLYGSLLDSSLGDVEDNVTIGNLFMQYLPIIVIAGVVLLIGVLSFKGGGQKGL